MNITLVYIIFLLSLFHLDYTSDSQDEVENDYDYRETYPSEDTDSENYYEDNYWNIQTEFIEENKTEAEIQDKLEALEQMEQKSETPNIKKRPRTPSNNWNEIQEDTKDNSPLLEKDNTQKISGLNTKFREDCLRKLEASLQKNFSTCRVPIDMVVLQQISLHVEYGCFLKVLTSTRMKNIYKSNVASLLSKINAKTKVGEVFEYESDVELSSLKKQKKS